MLLDEMNSVADDALENLRRIFSVKQFQNFKRQQKHSVQRHMSEVQHEVQTQQAASTEDIDHVRHELSQSLAGGSHYQNLFMLNFALRTLTGVLLFPARSHMLVSSVILTCTFDVCALRTILSASDTKPHALP